MTTTRTQQREPLPDVETHVINPSSLLDAVLEIGNRRRQVLAKMKEAVQKRDRDAVFERATELLGLVEPGTEG